MSAEDQSEGSSPISENEKFHYDSKEEKSMLIGDTFDGQGNSSGSHSGSSAEQSNESQDGADIGELPSATPRSSE
jgi:hypothetical protein